MATIQRRETAAGVRFLVRYTDPEGNQRAKSFTTHREARLHRNDIERALTGDKYVDPTGSSVRFETLAEDWHKGRIGLVAESTYDRDRTYLDSMILPTLGPYPVGRLNHAEIQSWIAGLADTGKARATVAKALAMVRAILADAERSRLITDNPAVGSFTLPKAPARRMQVLTTDEVATVADEAGAFYRAHVLTFAQTGLRFGELAGLNIGDVDFLRRTVTVKRALHEVNGTLTLDGQLKSPSAYRAFPIPRDLADLLGDHVARFGTGDDGTVFVGIRGGYLRRSNFLRRVLRPAATRAGVSDASTLRTHDLRHTHASLLFSAGVPIPVVSRRLGHANAAVTLGIYSHVIPGDEELAADTMGRYFADVPTSFDSWREAGLNSNSTERPAASIEGRRETL